ncbi:hypothetical protein [Tichowtungia aerotolerans]|uniref:Uncharacterized protein n=1 Tax=Tichowtungia aerotolerans TaxID=2697043 RepID=A0A6P1MBQ2_9BACT|nr:hypothetical protein [Tichowtungia aerotolerans]QHI69974.1 hypothetical protein GT409_11095 [Tichowtungia aerotolerans]
MSFQLKAGLASAVFRVMVSDDDGQTWNEEYSLDDYNGGSSWQQVVVGLSSYAGSEILIRFEYVPGSYYSPGGVWLDEIIFSGGNWYGWDTLQTFESVTGGVVTNLEVGTNTLAFQAFDGASYGARSPSFTVVVAEDDGDIDDDGLPDDWEILYFGGETNANPEAIASNGVNTLLGTYIAGLDPTDPDSLFKASMTNANGFVVQWNAASGRVYSVYGATNLLNGFQPLETNILWPQSSWTDTVSRSENFYKIDVELPE